MLHESFNSPFPKNHKYYCHLPEKDVFLDTAKPQLNAKNSKLFPSLHIHQKQQISKTTQPPTKYLSLYIKKEKKINERNVKKKKKEKETLVKENQ